jgi:hypothetical protein
VFFAVLAYSGARLLSVGCVLPALCLPPPPLPLSPHLLSVFVVPIEDSQGGAQIEHELLVSFNVDDFVVNKVEGLKLF